MNNKEILCDQPELEIWKDIEGYEGLYQISNYGRVKTIHIGKTGEKLGIRKLQKCGGYLRIYLFKNCIGKGFFVHRIVGKAFISNLDNKKNINHKDGNKENNFYKNLEWNTHKENTNHAHSTGLLVLPKGEGHYRTKLTNEDVLNIRKIYNKDRPRKDNAKQLSKIYNMTAVGIRDIVHRKSWKHI